jgi:hypothetical protein
MSTDWRPYGVEGYEAGPADVQARPAASVGVLGHAFAITMALAGGVLGIVGAFVNEVRAGGFILLPIVGAPIIEELLKPTGVYILLARWPRLLTGRLHTALLAGLAGLSFGVIEALVYIFVYVPDAPDWFVTYRLTVPLAFHACASFIVGLGIGPGLLDWVNGRGPLPKRTRNLYITAISLHAVFNLVATVLVFAGYFDVD